MSEEEMDKAHDAKELLLRLTKDFFEKQLPHFHLNEEQEYWLRLKMNEDMRFWK